MEENQPTLTHASTKQCQTPPQSQTTARSMLRDSQRANKPTENSCDINWLITHSLSRRSRGLEQKAHQYNLIQSHSLFFFLQKLFTTYKLLMKNRP